MSQVEITSARITSDRVAIQGTVDGRGYVVDIPKSDIDAAVGKAAKVRVAALALKAVDDEAMAGVIDLLATVTV